MDKYTAPNWNNCALITIDMQNDFVLSGAPAEIKGTVDILPRIVDLINTFREHNKPIVHVIRLYMESGSNVDLCRREKIESGLRIVTPGSQGSNIVEDITKSLGDFTLDNEKLFDRKMQKIGNNEWVMYKPRWGAFYQTNLEKFLHEQNIDTVIFCGCNFPNCPRTSIYEASERDFKVVLAQDAISGIYEKGITEIKNIGVTTYSFREVKTIITSNSL